MSNTYEGGAARVVANQRRPVDSHMWLVSGVEVGDVADAISGALQGGRVQVAVYPLTSDAGDVLLLEASPFSGRDAAELAEAVETIGAILRDIGAGRRAPKKRGAGKQLPMFGNPGRGRARRCNPLRPVMLGQHVDFDAGRITVRAYIVTMLDTDDPNASRREVVRVAESVRPLPDGRIRIVKLAPGQSSPVWPMAMLIELEASAVEPAGAWQPGNSQLELQVASWAARVMLALPGGTRNNPARPRSPKRPPAERTAADYPSDFAAGFAAGSKASAIQDRHKAYRKVSKRYGATWVEGYAAAQDVKLGATSTAGAVNAAALGLIPGTVRRNPAARESAAALAGARKDYETFHWGDAPDKTMKVRTAELTLKGPLVVLGELAEVAYDASKAGETARWVHAFGDGDAGKGTERPLLVVDRAGRLGIIGGSYDVRDVGIVG